MSYYATGTARSFRCALSRTLKLTGRAGVPFAGDFSQVDAGEQIPAQLDFVSCLALLSGDSIAQCAGAVTVYNGTDANAAALAESAATFSGTVVQQWLGTAFIVGVTYQWNASITTAKGAAYTLFARLYCANPQAPSAISTTVVTPGNPISISANSTIAQPGLYQLNANGISVTLPNPATWPFAQGFTIFDGTGASNPNQILVGNVNGSNPFVFVNAYESVTLVVDSTKTRWIVN